MGTKLPHILELNMIKGKRTPKKEVNMKILIRSAIPTDLQRLHFCFEASVRHSCSNDYNADQINAWISKATPERWNELLESDLHFILAEDTNTKHFAGFTSINTKGYLHSLFVHPSYQRQGVAKQLLYAAETFAWQNQVVSIHSEVSLTAKSFFEKMDYISTQEQTVLVNQVSMANFVMRKQLVKSFQEIDRPTPEEYEKLLQVWEASVRSTHYFLTEADIQFYKALVPSYFPAVDLYVIRNKQGSIAAFMGLSDTEIEMLFVHPKEQGKGLGKQLIHLAVWKKGIRKVDVNEQNTTASRFYQHMGFQIFGRDEVDSYNKPFPILHMQLIP